MSGAKRARSAITGRFVTLRWALRHKRISIIETLKKGIRS